MAKHLALLAPTAQARVPVLLGREVEVRLGIYRGPAAAVSSGEGEVQLRCGRLPEVAGDGPPFWRVFPEARKTRTE